MGEPRNALMHLDRYFEYKSKVNYHSTMIPYLDYIEESTEDFICTRDDGAIRTTLWNPNNLEFIRSG
ncbi:hypothetical protein R3W88_024815 [Solanum pinnatisectum]|uniref:Uncharacterized protein n=1 Tax=Solanum pinnatisectum TaxID=50273 RepID=A0AAV9M1R8_9SOLN|nr:hypothetical protein R3W88_024815 [Solanum pinnatisectum]